MMAERKDKEYCSILEKFVVFWKKNVLDHQQVLQAEII